LFIAITFGMWCNCIDAARLSQNATAQVLKAGATTPIEAPAALAVFADHAAAFHVFDGQLGKTRSMQVSSIAS
jgi:hypothetical protein